MHPRIFALWSSLLTFLVVALLPVWTAWSMNDWEGLGWSAPLFTVLAHLPRNAEAEGITWGLLELHAWNLKLALGTLAAGWGLGRLIYWSRWERRPPAPQGPR
jgi:hypothetical protein